MIWQWMKNDEPNLQRKLTIADDLPMKASKVKWGPYDDSLISIFEEGTVIGWSATTGRQLWLVSAHNSPGTSMNFSEDRMLMITSSKDQTAKLWAIDESEPELLKTYKSDRPINDAAISPLYSAEKDPKYHILMG